MTRPKPLPEIQRCPCRPSVAVNDPWCFVQCQNCHTTGPYRLTQEEAINSWNKLMALRQAQDRGKG